MQSIEYRKRRQQRIVAIELSCSAHNSLLHISSNPPSYALKCRQAETNRIALRISTLGKVPRRNCHGQHIINIINHTNYFNSTKQNCVSKSGPCKRSTTQNCGSCHPRNHKLIHHGLKQWWIDYALPIQSCFSLRHPKTYNPEEFTYMSRQIHMYQYIYFTQQISQSKK